MEISKEAIQQMIDKDEFETAEKLAREFADLDTSDSSRKIVLGRVLGIVEKYDESVEIFEKLLEIDKTNPDIPFYLGVSYHNQGKYSLAIDAYHKALEFDKRRLLIYYYLGRIYNNYEFEDRDVESAKRYFRKATADENPLEEAFIELSNIEDFSRKIYVINNGLRHFPNNPKLHTNLCEALYLNEKYLECIEAVEKAAKLGIENESIIYVSGLAFIKLKNTKSAIQSFQKIRAEDAKGKYVLRVLESLAYLASNDYQAAINILREVIAQDFGNQLEFSAHIILACCYLEDGNTSSAEGIFDEIPILNQFDPQILIAAPILYGWYDISDYLENVLNSIIAKSTTPTIAAKAFTIIAKYKHNIIKYSNQYAGDVSSDLLLIKEYLLKSLKVFPQNADIHSFLAEVLEDLNDWLGVAEQTFLSQALSFDDNYSYLTKKTINAIYDNKSLLDEFLNLIDKFIKDEYRFVRRFSSHDFATLVNFFHNKQEFEMVVHLAEKFSYEIWKDAGILFELAFAYTQTNNRKKAKTVYQSYLRDIGNNQAVANNLALIEEEDGNLHEAERLLKLALELDVANEKTPINLTRIQGKIKKLDEQKRAVQKAAELFLQETDDHKRVIADLFTQRTEDNLILCDPQKTSDKLGVKLERGKKIIAEFLQKNYFEEVKDHAIIFNGKVLRINPVLISHLEKELDRIKKLDFIDKISERLLSENLDSQYGYNKSLVEKLVSVNERGLAKILERDLNEAITSLVMEAYKSTLILCGSIVEAILLDQLLSNEDMAIHGLEVILSKEGKTLKSDDRKLEKWGLSRMLDVAQEINLISSNLYHWGHGIREFRNLVHPAIEYRKTIEVSRENAEMAWNAVKRLLKEIDEKGRPDSDHR